MRQLGLKPGPVQPSTRKTYISMLEKRLADQRLFSNLNESQLIWIAKQLKIPISNPKKESGRKTLERHILKHFKSLIKLPLNKSSLAPSAAGTSTSTINSNLTTVGFTITPSSLEPHYHSSSVDPVNPENPENAPKPANLSIFLLIILLIIIYILLTNCCS